MLNDSAAEVYIAPVSFGQRRLWLTDCLDPGRPTYNVPVALRVSGPLSPGLLRAALAALTDRHETLRTAFGVEDDEPVQLISAALAPAFAVVDLSGLDPGRRDAEARRGLAAEAERPFDLERPPLLRTTLFTLGPDDHRLLLTLHHIVTDGWSLGVLVRELLALYAAGAEGRPAALPELPIQYADFAAWQRQILQGETLATKLRPWLRRLEGAPVVLELPVDHSRGSSRAGATVPFELDGPALAALRDLARAGGATLFMAVLAGYQALLARWTGRHDLIVSVPVANRNRLETENVVGFFVNTLALRGDLGGDPGFRQVLARVREVAVEAFAHEDLPVELLVDELRPERLYETSLFQVALGFQQPTVPEMAAAGLVLCPLPLHSQTAKFDLSLQLSELPDRLVGFWELDAARFDRATVQRLSGHLARLFAAAVADPDRPLSALPLLAPAERHQLLVEHNDAATEYPREATLPGLFAEQAARTPDAPAVEGPGGVLTYRDLARRAAAVARRLRALGLVPDDRVGVRLQRGADQVAAFLGILQAGGAYVPLDPGYPEERLAFMAEDAGLRALLTSVEGEEADPAPPPDELTADHLAYVIYTSGSTGRPKGVAVTHRAVVRLVKETNYVQLTPGDRVAQASNASFDAATFEIWGALLNGACLVILDRETTLAPDLFARALVEQRITALFLTTALFNLLANADPACFRTLSHLLFGGEAVDPTRVAAVLAAGPPARLLHVYGPTESTTFATWQVLDAVPPGAWSLPIGRPLANTRALLLDAGFQPVPIGAHGEVFLGGDGLARGYFGSAPLTAERFVPDPFGSGDRLYRTGDLARQRADGAIEFLGRLDSQVKIRGFRIEPAEVEAVLGTHPSVAECIVVPRRGAEGVGLTLTAYLVRRPGAALTPRQMRGHLKARLPEYMIPSAFVELGALPRTPNGKVDRAALPAPGSRAEAAFVAPRTPVEEVLAGLWASWLGAERIGAHDNFFDLGGNSLTATSLTSQARATFQAEIPVRALFESPTLSAFAERVEELAAAAAGLRLPPIVPVPHDGEAPLSFSQQRLWLINEMSRGASPFYNVAGALSLAGALDAGALAAAFSEIVRRHEALRTSFRPGAGGPPVQIVHPPRPLPLPIVDLSGLPPERREAEGLARLRAEARLPFDLTAAPLLRARLVRLDGERHLLSFVLHHIVSDGWSLDVLLRELGRLYTAFAERAPSPLPELPVQYADFALWQRRWLAGEELVPQLDYWRRQLAGAPLVLELPTDRPRPPVERFAGAMVPVALPEGAIERLQALSREHRATPFMTLLAAWGAFLSRLTGQSDLLIGSPSANRNRDEIADLIGFFVNLLVLRTDLGQDPGFAALLGRTRETALGAYAHQDLPFERLVEELRPARDTSRHPLFQVSFSFVNLAWTGLDMPVLEGGFVDLESPAELFDLSLRMTEARERWDARLSYNVDLFEPATAARLARQLEGMVAQVLDDPERPISSIPLLAEEESREVLAVKAETGTPPPPAISFPVGPADLEVRFPLHVYEKAVTELWADLLGLDLQEVGPEANFFELGGHSMLLQVVRVKLQEAFGLEIAILDLFNHPTVQTLGLHLRNLHAGISPEAPGPAAAPAAEAVEETGEEIAIVGLSGRFPGARDAAELWRALSDGRESISLFSDSDASGDWTPPAGSSSHRVPAGGVIEGPDLWDADFFGYSPREAELMDPQQRLFLEHAWLALEDAGYDPERHAGPVGVFGGVGKSDYLLRAAAAGVMNDPVGSQLASLGCDRDFVTTRVSYKLGLEGPSLNVQTACSTGLVAVHLACRSLLAGECDLALAGAASVTAYQRQGYLYREGGVLSPDGHCRPFDAGAAGSVDSDGVGVVALKRLRDARADGDAIRAVIRASGVNNDGGSRVGFTAPRVATQARLIRSVLERAGLTADRIGCLEAHGTATPLGDPIEVEALIEAFRTTTAEAGYCALGSIKSNFGHANAAAGIAGLLKVVLALEHRQIPPSLHFERPNPAIRLEGSPFFVNTTLRSWEPRGGRRRAGVSSFGMGGTNVHAVIEEAPPAPAPEPPARPWQLLVLSARTPAALDEATRRLAAHLARHPALSLADVAFTLQNGRRAFEHRRAVLARDPDEAVAALEALDPERTATGRAAQRGAPVAFLLPGQGAQEPGMAAGLYRDEPVFRDELDRAAEAFRPHLSFDLREVLTAEGPGRTPPRAAELARTEVAQPALFAVEHALARTWMAWGVRPRALLGHSLGEYVAGCLAGVLSLDDAAVLVAARGRLLQGLPPGAMLAVPLPPEEVEPLLVDGLALAAVNGPARTVVSGPPEAVAALEELLAGRGAAGRRLATSHAFHSPMMDPVLPLFAAEVRKVRLAPPSIPYLSNLTGTWIRPGEATDPDYWVRHLRETVHFAPALAELLSDPTLVLLEAGPGRTLAGAARQALPTVPARQGGGLVALPSLPPTPDAPEAAFALLTLGRLWAAGVEVDWPALHAGTRRSRLPLPTYPFERRRFWIDLPREKEQWPVQPVGASFSALAEPVAPLREESAILRQLAGIWRDLLHVEEAGPDADFFALGGDSLLAIGLASRLREEFGVEIPVRELLVRPRLSQLAAAVDEALARRPGALPRTLVPLQEGRPGRLPFFAIHPSGGNVVCYRPLVGRLDPDRPLYALQAPGLEGEQEPYLHVADLAAYHVATVRRVQPAGPYVVGGWSSGGMVAFEMARQLEQQGDQALVVLLDTFIPAPGAAMDDLDLLLWKAAALDVPFTAADLAGHDDFRTRLSALLARATKGLPPAEAAARQRLLAVEISSLAGFFHYRPQPLAAGAMVAVRATGHLTPDGVPAGTPFPSIDVATAWRPFTSGPFILHETAADHDTLLQEPWVDEVAALLDRHLEELEAPVPDLAL